MKNKRVIPERGIPFHFVINCFKYTIQPTYKIILLKNGDTNPCKTEDIVYNKTDIIIQCSIFWGYTDFIKLIGDIQ